MKDEVRKILELIRTNTEFQKKENSELIGLLMKVEPGDIPDDSSNEVSEIINMLLLLKWPNNENEYQHLDMISNQLRKHSAK